MYNVTIAIALFNAEKYIKKTLTSALNQTFNYIEYLIINDRGISYDIKSRKFLDVRVFTARKGKYFFVTKFRQLDFYSFEKDGDIQWLQLFKNTEPNYHRLRHQGRICMDKVTMRIYVLNTEKNICDIDVDWSERRGCASDNYFYL